MFIIDYYKKIITYIYFINEIRLLHHIYSNNFKIISSYSMK